MLTPQLQKLPIIMDALIVAIVVVAFFVVVVIVVFDLLLLLVVVLGTTGHQRFIGRA